MKIRWQLVGSIATLALGVIPLVNQKTATAAALQASTPAVETSLLAKNAPPPAGISIPDTTLAINSSTSMSQRVVHYEIDAKYDSVKHTVDATEVLTYHNLTGQPLDHFPFHLYQNAFQPNATWIRETKVAGGRDVSYENWEDKDYGSEEIQSLEVVGQGDLTSNVQYIQP